MMEERRTSWVRRAAAPLLAVGIHAALALVLSRMPMRVPSSSSPTPSPSSRTDEKTIDIVLSAEESHDITSSAAPMPTAQDEDAPRAHALSFSHAETAESEDLPRPPHASSTDGHLARKAAEPPRATEPPPPPSSSDLPNDGATSVPSEPNPSPLTIVGPRSAPDIGLSVGGGKNPFLPKNEAAVEAAEQKRAVDHAMKDPAREKERALGLGPEGPVLTALADGTARSVAPVRGRAVFVATSNAQGEVVSLELLDAEGGRPGWADAGRIALEGLKGKKLRVAPGSTRAVMKIEVVSAWKLPSGQDPGTDVTLFHIPIAKGEGKDSPKVAILDPIPKVRIDYLEIGPGVKVPVVSMQIDLFQTNIDPSNAGAKARRIIHTRVLDSQVM